MKKVTLGSIAVLQTGYTFRSGLVAAPDGFMTVQLKDVHNDGTIDISSLFRVTNENFKEPHFLCSGDLVFRSRGSILTMGIVPDIKEKIVLAAPLIKVRVDRSVVIPEYIAWYLNSSEGQALFSSETRGSATQMITKASLTEIELPLPPLSSQQTISEISRLSAKEKEISDCIIKKRAQLFTTQIRHYLYNI